MWRTPTNRYKSMVSTLAIAIMGIPVRKPKAKNIRKMKT
jgi:hypothetical protein